jgi:hypothetical protein
MRIDRIALATRKGLLILSHESSWRVRHESFPGSHVSIVFLDPRSGHLFACLDDGHFGNKLFRWSNFLQHENWAEADPKEVWQEQTVPKYPAGAQITGGDDAVLKYIWAFSAGSENQPGKLFIGSEPGGLFVSQNDGDSFELNEPLWNHPSRIQEGAGWFGGGRDNPGIHSVCVDPRNDQHIRVGISCAGVFQSADGGQSWVPTNKGLKADFLPSSDVDVGHDPHLLVQCQGEPDVLWQQNHCGIFRSSDGGRNWQDVSDAGNDAFFGFAIAVDPSEGQTAWVVPAESDMVRSAVNRRLCVCRTEDGGQSWQTFTAGLPQEDCFDFAFRHCLVYRDNELVFGTACGSLYLSQDRGENWRAINNHLPPIYCVAVI